MYKFFLNLVLILYFLFQSAFAVEWLELTSIMNKTVSLDVDSITIYKNYYFYNIKYKNDAGKTVIATIQSGLSRPLSARIALYGEDEYKIINNDYSDITKNYTDELEPVTYGSIVFTCYKKVKELKPVANIGISIE